MVKEIASGVNDSRPKLLSLVGDTSITLLVVEHRDRLTRFGFHYIETLFKTRGRKIEVVNQADNGTEDLLADLVSIISSFCARLYGQRRAKRKTEKIVAALEEGEMMQLVEKHVISKTDPRYAAIDRAAFASKNLYNAALYEIRQSFIHHGKYLYYNQMDKIMQKHEAYRMLPEQSVSAGFEASGQELEVLLCSSRSL